MTRARSRCWHAVPGSGRQDARVLAAERLLPALLRALGATWRYEVEGLEHLREARERSPEGRVLFCLWHGGLLPLAHVARGRAMRALVSRNRDGEIAVRVAARLGFVPVRGSSSRGGARAVREALRGAGGADLAVTPDGPRGPRQRFQSGAVFLAARAGLPIVPVGCGADRAWRLSSWDGFLVPRPFARVRVVCGPPLLVPPQAGGESRERCRTAAERALAAATARAEGRDRVAAATRGSLEGLAELLQPWDPARARDRRGAA
ncbi:MAG: lysophospholipid acyltransferase family protein [Gemmatimonadota bacterium]